MRTKWYLGAGILLVILVTMTGCGVAKEEHSQVVSDLETLKAKYTSLQAQYAELQDEREELDRLYVLCKNEFDTLENEYAALKADVQRLEDALHIGPSHASTRTEIFNDPDYQSTYYENDEERITKRLESILRKLKQDCKSLPAEYQPDPYDKAIQLWCLLFGQRIGCFIVLGNLSEDSLRFKDANDVWLMILYPDDSILAVDAESLAIQWGRDYDGELIPENQPYYNVRGFAYANPSNFKADISYRWQMKEVDAT